MFGFKICLDLSSKECSNPKTSIVLTVFNQVDVIEEVIRAICRNTQENFELIIIDDSSTDGTSEKLCLLLPLLIHQPSLIFCKKLTRVFLARSRISNFETACDQRGIESSMSPIIILIQADIFIEEFGFDVMLRDAIMATPTIFLLSSRGVQTHLVKKEQLLITNKIKTKLYEIFNFKVLPQVPMDNSSNNKETNEHLLFEKIFPNRGDFAESGVAGFRGQLLNSWESSTQRYKSKIPKSTIWVGLAGMRGPCVFRKERFLELGGFDQKSFFLGFDDMDLCVRAYYLKQWSSGFYPITFSSPDHIGNTRRPRSRTQKLLLVFNHVIKSRSIRKSYLYHVLSNREKYDLYTNEIISLQK